MEINGKKVIVIGGASGMGRASAELLHARGASVAIFDREGGLVVKVAVGELGQHRFQLLGRPADVDDDAVVVEDGAPEGGVDHVGRAVQALRRPEGLASQAVGDHDVVADVHTEHGHSPS